MPIIPSINQELAQFAGGLYRVALGSVSNASFVAEANSQGLAALFNRVYNATFGSQSVATVANTLVANLGIVAGSNGLTASDVLVAQNYVANILNNTAPASRGMAIASILDMFAGLATDAKWGGAATTWSQQVASNMAYTALSSGNGADVSSFAAAAANVQALQATVAADVQNLNSVGVAGQLVIVQGEVATVSNVATANQAITDANTAYSMSVKALGIANQELNDATALVAAATVMGTLATTTANQTAAASALSAANASVTHATTDVQLATTQNNNAVVLQSLASASINDAIVGSLTQRFALGLSEDNLSVASYAVINGTGQSFSTQDVIHGSGVNNTLNITDSTSSSSYGVPAGVAVSGIQNMVVSTNASVGNMHPSYQTNTYVMPTTSNMNSTWVASFSSPTQSDGAGHGTSLTANPVYLNNVSTANPNGQYLGPMVGDVVSFSYNGYTSSYVIQSATASPARTGQHNTAVAFAQAFNAMANTYNFNAAAVVTDDSNGQTSTVTINSSTTSNLPAPVLSFSNNSNGDSLNLPNSVSGSLGNPMPGALPGDIVYFTINGTSTHYTVGVDAKATAESFKAAVNAYFGSTTAASVTSTVTNLVTGNIDATHTQSETSTTASVTVVNPVAGAYTLEFTGATSAADLPAGNLISTGQAQAVYDVSTFAGLQNLNVVASTGTDYIKAAATTNVGLADSAGLVTINGGKDVTVSTTAGAVNVGYLWVNSTGLATTVGAVKTTGAVKITTDGPNAVQVNGGTSVTTTSEGDVTLAGATGAVTVTDSGVNNGNISVNGGAAMNVSNLAGNGNITLKGGTTVNVLNQGGTGTITLGDTTQTMTAATSTTPDILSADYPTGNVVIDDSVTVNGVTTYGSGAIAVYTNGASSVSIKGGAAATVLDANTYARHLTNSADTAAAGVSALASVTLNHIGGSGSVTSDALTAETLTNNASRAITNTVTPAHALTVTSAGNTGSTSLHDATATSLVLNTSGATAAATDALAVTLEKASSLTINNSVGAYTLGGVGNVGSSSTVTAITVTTTGSGATDLGDLRNAKVTAVNASAATGNVTATIDATKATFSGGSGNDTLTVSAVPLKAISGGDGIDTLILNLVGSSYVTPTNVNRMISGFEILGLGTNASGSYDGTGFATESVANTVSGDVTFTNLEGGNTLNVSAAPTQNITATYANATGSNDVITLNLGTATGVGTDFASGGKIITLDGAIETVNLNSLGSTTQTAANNVSLVDAGVKTLVIGGAHNLAVALTGTAALTTVNASAATGAVDLSNVSVKSTGASFTGGAGLLTVVGGAGADTIVSGAGGVNVTPGAGGDNINLSAATAAASTITIDATQSLFNSYDVITGFKDIAGNNADVLNFDGTPSLLAANGTASNTNILGVYYTVNAAGVIAFSGPSLAFVTASQLISAAEALVDTAGANRTAAFVYAGDTYVVHAASSSAGTANDSVVKLVGVSDVTALSATAGATTVKIA